MAYIKKMAKVLWQKESMKRKLVYVDIFDGCDDFFLHCYLYDAMNLEATMPTKNNAIAHKAAIMANALGIDDEKVEAAIQEGNRSLCFAEIGCEEVGLVHGLRAYYFLSLKQYSLCLADIELAKKNKYPSLLMPLLDEHKKECLLAMDAAADGGAQLAEGPQLSFPADAKIPCFAQGLEVKYSKNYGHHVVTNRKLEIGQTVIIEEAYCMTAENAQNYSQCANCYERKANLIPCKNCSAIMFCSQHCYDEGHEQFHAIECGHPSIYSNWNASIRMVTLTVIKAIKSFPSVSHLMNAVERFNSRKSNDSANYTNPSTRAYLKFFGLTNSLGRTSQVQNGIFMEKTKAIHSLFLSNAAYSSLFGSVETSRFLAHLIMHHFHVINLNGCDAISFLHDPYTNELGTTSEHLSGFVYAQGLYLNSCRLNHSCQPNIARIFIGNKLIGKVIRPIKPGEQLFVSYLNPFNLAVKSIEYRKKKLTEIYYVECKCGSCVGEFPPFQSSGNVNLDVSICRLFEMLESSPRKDPSKYSLIVNRDELLNFEKSAIKYLEGNEHLHPTRETLLVQFFLAQIWNNLGR